MKSVLLLSIFLCMMTGPVLGALLPEDLDKIRLIVKEEVDPIKTEVATIKQDIATLNGRIDGLSGGMNGLSERIEGIEKKNDSISTTYKKKRSEKWRKCATLNHNCLCKMNNISLITTIFQKSLTYMMN